MFLFSKQGYPIPHSLTVFFLSQFYMDFSAL